MANNPDWKARSIEALEKYHPQFCATVERLNKGSCTWRVMGVNKETLRITVISQHVANILGSARSSDPFGVIVESLRGIHDLQHMLREATGNPDIEVYSP